MLYCSSLQTPCLPCGQVCTHLPVCHLPTLFLVLPKCPEWQHGACILRLYGYGMVSCHILTFRVPRSHILIFAPCALPPLQCKFGKPLVSHGCWLAGLPARSYPCGTYITQSHYIKLKHAFLLLFTQLFVPLHAENNKEKTYNGKRTGIPYQEERRLL